MSALTSLPAWVLVCGASLFMLGTALAGRFLARAIVPEAEYDHVQGIASPLMPALGALFAVLIAVTVASESGYLKSAQQVIEGEAAAASRLAWSSTNPGVESGPIHTALEEYLTATRSNEWDGPSAADGSDPRTRAALIALEQAVRAEASSSSLATPIATELLAGLDSVTSARRARLAEESRQIPVLYVVTLIASGAALVANAGALGFRSSLRTASLAIGLALVVALGLALLLTLSEPWQGALTVSGEPIDAVIRDLGGGFFAP